MQNFSISTKGKDFIKLLSNYQYIDNTKTL